MPTQLCYIINRSLSIHEPLNARFLHRMVGYISWQPCILSRFRQKFSDLIFSMRSSIVPNGIVRHSAMVYCQEKRGVGFLHLVRTMAGKLKINTNWTARGMSGVGFWINSPAVAISLSCFWSLFGFHTRACFPLTGSSSTTIPPHCSLKHSSLALNPKCKDSIHHTVRWRTSKQQVFFIFC